MITIEQVARKLCGYHYDRFITKSIGNMNREEYIDDDWEAFTGDASVSIQALIDSDWPDVKDTRCAGVDRNGNDVLFNEGTEDEMQQIVYADLFDVKQIAKAMLSEMIKG